MYKILLVFFTITLICTNIVFSQVLKEKSYRFSGIVYDKDSLKPIKNVRIQINNEKLVISKENGQFFFSANLKDTVIIYREGLKNLGFIIQDTLISMQNLLGVFMAKDTVIVNNIIIYPKTDENDLRTIMLTNQPKDQQTLNAENKAKSISNQAKTNNNLELDATSIQKNVLRKYDSQVEYKYMISPDNMITVTGIYKYIKEIIKESQKEKAEIEMTKKDENLLKELFLKNQNR